MVLIVTIQTVVGKQAEKYRNTIDLCEVAAIAYSDLKFTAFHLSYEFTTITVRRKKTTKAIFISNINQWNC